MKKIVIICSILVAILAHLYIIFPRTFSYNGITVSYNYSYGGKLTTKVLVENEMIKEIAGIPLFRLVNPQLGSVAYYNIGRKMVEIVPFNYNDFSFTNYCATATKETRISLIDYLRSIYVEILPASD